MTIGEAERGHDLVGGIDADDAIEGEPLSSTQPTAKPSGQHDHERRPAGSTRVRRSTDDAEERGRARPGRRGPGSRAASPRR